MIRAFAPLIGFVLLSGGAALAQAARYPSSPSGYTAEDLNRLELQNLERHDAYGGGYSHMPSYGPADRLNYAEHQYVAPPTVVVPFPPPPFRPPTWRYQDNQADQFNYDELLHIYAYP